MHQHNTQHEMSSASLVITNCPLDGCFAKSDFRSVEAKRHNHMNPQIDSQTKNPPADVHRSRRRSRGRVAFDDITTVRWYSTVLGDNPTVSDGPPVSIGWCYTTEKIPMRSAETDVDSDHSLCSGSSTNGSQKRHPRDFYLDAPTRIERLRRNGYSRQEIKDVVAEIETIQRLRRANAIRRKVSAGKAFLASVKSTPANATNANRKYYTVGKTMPSTTGEAILPRTKRGGLLTWTTTPQRSRFSLESTRRTSTSTSEWLYEQHNYCFHAKTPFPRRRSSLTCRQSLPTERQMPFGADDDRMKRAPKKPKKDIS